MALVGSLSRKYFYAKFMLQRMPVLSLTTIIHVWGQLALSLFFTGLLPCSLSSVHHFVILTTSFPFSSCQFLFLLVLFSSPCLLHSCVPLISFSHSLLLSLSRPLRVCNGSCHPSGCDEGREQGGFIP